MNKYTIEVSNKFKKDFKLCLRRGLPMDKLRTALTLLTQTGSLPPEYNAHKLTGNYAGLWECHINGRKSDWLLVWEQNDTTLTLLMLRTGSHSDIF